MIFAGGYGEIQIALLMTKGQLELEILSAKGLGALSRGESAPGMQLAQHTNAPGCLSSISSVKCCLF
jgi:hypothetical protein